MKKRTKILSFLLAVCTFGVLGALTIGSVSASAADKSYEVKDNHTIEVQSGFKSGFFGTVSNHAENKGVSVEFDLYESNLKTINYNPDFDVMSTSGTGGSMSCVSFVFGREQANFPDKDPSHVHAPAWMSYIPTDHNLGGFQYFSNGQIKEWADQGNSALITEYIGYPSLFMEPGYSYKVMLRQSAFEFEGKIYNQEGMRWYCVERKGIFDDASQYEVLFAYQRKLGGQISPGTLAGMEIQGLCKKGNDSTGQCSIDGKGHSLEMTLDNFRVYDGYDLETAKNTDGYIVREENFEKIDEEKINLNNTTKYAAEVNKFDGKDYLEFDSKVRYVSVNFGRVISETVGSGDKGEVVGDSIEDRTVCRLWLREKPLYTVEFKDETGEVLETRNTFIGHDFSGTKIFTKDGQQVYQFDYSEYAKDEFKVLPSKGYFEVSGKPVPYLTMRLFSSDATVSNKVKRVSAIGRFPLTSDLLEKPDHELVGFSVNEDCSTIDYKIGNVVDMKCQDVSLYAIWKLKEFNTVYKSGHMVMDTQITNPREVPFYNGATPEKRNYIFSGWDTTFEIDKSQTISAKFVQIADVNADNKAMATEEKTTFKKEGYGSYAIVDVSFDLLVLPQGAKIEILGADITKYVEEGYSIKISVDKKGTITIAKSYIGENDYVKTGTAVANSSNNESVEFSFEKGIVFDTLAMSFDGRNTFVDTFEGAESGISEGIYQNYYTVSGSASIKPWAKNLTVTFKNADRTIAVVPTYEGGKVKLPAKVEGAVDGFTWNRTQEQLNNVTESIDVEAKGFEWKDCTVNFKVTSLFGFLPVSGIPFKSIPDKPVTQKYGTEFELPYEVYPDSQYAIIGWTDVEGSSFAKYTDTYVFTNWEKPTTLYSVWGGKSLTVVFCDENGEPLPDGEQTIEYYGSALYKGEVPAKEGYKFIGWDKSTVNVTDKEADKEGKVYFIAQYEKVLAKVQVSVLGGTGSGLYTEGDEVTVEFSDIAGLEFIDWVVASGEVEEVSKSGNSFTFIVGNEDVEIQAIQEGEEPGVVKPPESAEEEGCGSIASIGMVSIALILGGACFALRRKDEK